MWFIVDSHIMMAFKNSFLGNEFCDPFRPLLLDVRSHSLLHSRRPHGKLLRPRSNFPVSKEEAEKAKAAA